MSAQPQALPTLDEYLALDRDSEMRHEYVEGEIFAMSGASREHNLICSNLVAELHPRLKQKGCETYSNDMRTRIPEVGVYTYPDLVVVCGEPRFEDAEHDTLLNPTLVVEVLSPSTEGYDRGHKAIYYRSIPSLQAFMLVSQDERRIELFTRLENGQWLLSEAEGPDGVLEVAAIGSRLRLADVYDGVPDPVAATPIQSRP